VEQYGQLKDKYIDPFTDFGFKKLFGEECNKGLLLNFLNGLLHNEKGKIVSLTYLKTEKLDTSSEESRKTVFDLYCENKKGEKLETIEIAKNAKILGLSIEQIQKLTNLSIEEIEKI
jgi:uncharacterized protein YuzE